MLDLQNKKQDAVSRLIYELSKLPGIGEKTATRLAYFILKQDESYTSSLAEALLFAKQKTKLCSNCMTFTDLEICVLCSDLTRDSKTICVVERPSDLRSIELSGKFKGHYHVLHGALSPLDGVGPEELKIKELLNRIKNETNPINEIIIAMNPSVEGDATALYLLRLIKPLGIKITQLAQGIPMGGQIEYADRQTVGKAVENRMELKI